MSETTSIAWCDSTWNPWEGCSKISPGCDSCYAEARNQRFHGGVNWGPGAPRRRTSPAYWRQPLAWDRKARESGQPWRVFCGSLCDVFDNEVPVLWRDELFALISLTPHLDWMLLTKRVGNAGAYINDPETPRRVDIIKHVILAGRQQELHAEERESEIPGWPGYFITSKGRVLSDRTNAGTRGTQKHEVKPQPGKAGHERVMLRVEGNTTRELIHRLVLSCFDRAPKAGEQGCHIDGNPANNALWNLRWGDQQANWQDSKRHGTRRRYSKLRPEDAASIRARHAAGETAAAIARDCGISETQVRNIARGAQWKPEYQVQWPPRSMWLGVTVVNQEEADRDIPKLLAVPAAVRFLSLEPMLGPIDLAQACAGLRWKDPDGVECCGVPRLLDWVIVGGESDQPGHRARPFNIAWARDIVRQCKAAGVPVVVKQIGSRPNWCAMRAHGDDQAGEHYCDAYEAHECNAPCAGRCVMLTDRAGADPSEWPEDLCVREFPR